MGSYGINVKLQCSQDLVLVDTYVFFELLHFLFIKGLSPIRSEVYDVVETITEGFQSTVNILQLRS